MIVCMGVASARGRLDNSLYGIGNWRSVGTRFDYLQSNGSVGEILIVDKSGRRRPASVGLGMFR